MSDRIEELEAQLAKVTAERDGWGALLADAYGAILDWDEVLKDRADQEAIAAIPRAYRMGLEDAAQVRVQGTVGMVGLTDRVADAIRAIPTPTDLVERVMKETGQ